MIYNYIKLAVRNIFKHKGFSLINITGLAIGIACSLFILIFVIHELSYDRFHEKAERTYRLAVRASVGNTKIRQTYSSSMTFKRLLADFPEIETGVKFLNLGRIPVVVREKTYYESRIYAVDATFFDVFSIPLIKGDPRTVLTEPNTMVITRETALKYFGNIDAIGEILRADYQYGIGSIDFKITGISESLPANSHFHYELLTSSASFPAFVNDTEWDANNFISYIVLKEGTSARKLEEKFKDFVRKYKGNNVYDAWVAKGNYWEYFLQPVTRIHLTSDLNGEFEANGNEAYIYIFSTISIIILLIACINFMNLSTAKSSLRAKEVALRKVVGSGRSRLIIQFLSESTILSFTALSLGVLIVTLLLPVYKSLIGRPLEIQQYINLPAIVSLLALGLLVGVISGSYPAFFLSSVNPNSALKGFTTRGKGGSWLRNILVIFQFTISIFLIIGTLTVNQQLKFFQNKKLGFDKEQVLVISNPGALGKNLLSFKKNLKGFSSILTVSGSNTLPGKDFINNGFWAENVDQSFTLNLCVCDHDFLDTLKLELDRGRFFSWDFPSDSHAAILNQKAVELLGWQDPLGRRIGNWEQNEGRFTVIGVVKDFHYESLHQEIRPQVLFLSGGYFDFTERFISIRINTENLQGTIGTIEKAWNIFAPGKPFEYSFLDDDYNRLYLNEKQTRKLFLIFSVLAIFIACLGLFGLASFIADRRTKEIGIRKVLGASIPGIIRLLNKSFMEWVLLANLLAWPIAWVIMNRWLRNFAYRIELSWWMFVLGAVLSVTIALITVSFQIIRAAMGNPVDSLRYE